MWRMTLVALAGSTHFCNYSVIFAPFFRIFISVFEFSLAFFEFSLAFFEFSVQFLCVWRIITPGVRALAVFAVQASCVAVEGAFCRLLLSKLWAELPKLQA